MRENAGLRAISKLQTPPWRNPSSTICNHCLAKHDRTTSTKAANMHMKQPCHCDLHTWIQLYSGGRVRAQNKRSPPVVQTRFPTSTLGATLCPKTQGLVRVLSSKHHLHAAIPIMPSLLYSSHLYPLQISTLCTSLPSSHHTSLLSSHPYLPHLYSLHTSILPTSLLSHLYSLHISTPFIPALYSLHISTLSHADSLHISTLFTFRHSTLFTSLLSSHLDSLTSLLSHIPTLSTPLYFTSLLSFSTLVTTLCTSLISSHLWRCIVVSCDDALLWWCIVVVMYCCGDVLLWWHTVVVMYCCDGVLLWWCIVVICCDDVLWWCIVVMMHCCGDVLLFKFSKFRNTQFRLLNFHCLSWNGLT